MDVSIVIPFLNESPNLKPLCEELKAALDPMGKSYEVLFIDDGSTDDGVDVLEAFRSEMPQIKVVSFRRNFGQTAAMVAGLDYSQGEIVVTLDADRQNDPADIPNLIAKLSDPNIDVICGYRAERKDTASRRYASKIANAIRRSFIKDGVRDTGCSLKAFRKEAVDHLVPFNGMHRYIPALMLQAGMKIDQVPVNHRERSAGSSKYTNWERGLRGIHELIGDTCLVKRKVRFNMGEKAEN